MAATIASAHAGILTSEFEGMPRCVLETLAIGRPVVAMHLPQLESVIHDGQSGYLVPREGSEEQMADVLAERFLAVRQDIAQDRIAPEAVAASIEGFTPGTQLARVFHYHQEIQNARSPLVMA